MTDTPWRHQGRLALGLTGLVSVLVLAAGVAGPEGGRAAAATTPVVTAGQLTPTPAQATAETPRVYGDRCVRAVADPSAALPTGSAAVPGCHYTPNLHKGSVVLVGDSHAAAISPAVLSVAKAQGWRLTIWARNSCPMADATRPLADRPNLACDAYRQTVLRALVVAHPALVVMAGYDSAPPAEYERDRNGTPTTPVTGAAAQSVYLAGLERTLGTLVRAHIRVLVIHDTPGYLTVTTGPSCVLAHPDDVSVCSAAQRDVLSTGEGDLAAVRAARYVGAIDFTNAFCHGGRCYQVIGTTLAYRDYNHLTGAMALRLAPALRQAMLRRVTGHIEIARVPALSAG